VYGIDMPTRQELVAFNRTDKEIAAEIGADEIIFQVDIMFNFILILVGSG
jgi:glutamine phosphoribosylpyrophosphate amidotransferase